MAEKIWAVLSNELAGASADAGRSVVSVQGRRHPSSGIVFTSDSVITVHHALRREEDATIVLAPGQRIAARVAGRDPSTDLALLRLEQPVKSPVALWDKGSELRIGELVLALARTRRGNIVASSGIVSGYINQPWRTWHGGELDRFIRPDLNFYPGFSGGPLLNSDGVFLGINTAGLHRSGITIPAATVVRVAAELLEKGRIERPYLGLAMQAAPLTESLRAKLNLTATEGLLVVHVEPGSPAEKAGVLLGDVLLELGDKPVADTDTVQDQLRSTKSGGEIQAVFIRGGAIVKAKVKLEARPAR
ncbi:MAG TPA: trypsin-like peptidase domain-containing protein [Candidatus Angelobacter sp.]